MAILPWYELLDVLVVLLWQYTRDQASHLGMETSNTCNTANITGNFHQAFFRLEHSLEWMTLIYILLASADHVSCLYPLHPAPHWTENCFSLPPLRVEVGGCLSWSCEGEKGDQGNNNVRLHCWSCQSSGFWCRTGVPGEKCLIYLSFFISFYKE